MIPRLIASVLIAIGLLAAIVLTASKFVLPDTAHLKGWVPPLEPAAPLPERRPIGLSIESDRSVTPVRLRGRFLAAFETYHFQPHGSDDLLWVHGNTAPLDALYEKLVAQPRRNAGIRGWKPGNLELSPPSAVQEHLCLSVLLTGSIEVIPTATFNRLLVEKVLSTEVLDLKEDECLRWRPEA